MVASVLPVVVAAAGGLVVFTMLRRHGWDAPRSALLALVLAPGVGFGVLSLAFFFLAFAGFSPPGRWLLVGLSVVLASVLVWPVVSGIATARRASDRASGKTPIRRRLVFGVVLALACISLGLLLWSFPNVTAAQPFGGWDAWAIWNAHSLFLYRAGEDLAETYSNLRHGHPDYPLLLPAALAAQYSLLSHEDVQIPQVTGLLFALATGALLFQVVWRYASATAAAAAVAVLWSTPAFWRWMFLQYADIPLSYLLLAASTALASQLDDDERYRWPPVLAGFCWGLLTWIKNEGLVLALLLAAAFAAVLLITIRPWGLAKLLGPGPGRSTGRDTLRRLPWIVAGAAPVLMALGLFKSFWSPKNETAMFLADATAKLFDVDRWRPVITAFSAELNPWSGFAMWGLLWPFLVVCGVVFWRQRAAIGRPMLFLGCVLLLIWAIWPVVYVCTPANQVWHLNSSLKRLLLQLAPLMLAWALAGTARAPESPA